MNALRIKSCKLHIAYKTIYVSCYSPCKGQRMVLSTFCTVQALLSRNPELVSKPNLPISDMNKLSMTISQLVSRDSAYI